MKQTIFSKLFACGLLASAILTFTSCDDDNYGTSLILAGKVTADGEANLIDGTEIDFGLNVTTPRPAFTTAHV